MCSEIQAKLDPVRGDNSEEEMKEKEKQKEKPRFRPAKDDTKPILRDPILRSDPIESEQAVLRLPPFPRNKPQF